MSSEVVQVVDPREEAMARVMGRFDARVLEPSPPGVAEPPWFADDPVRDAPAGPALPVMTPVRTADAELLWDTYATGDPALASWCADRWLGCWRRLELPQDVAALVRTRNSWHALAEHVIAPARHRANGKIGLRFTRGGFGTPFFGAGLQLKVSAAGFFVVRDGEIAGHPFTTVRAAAHAAGVAPGAPTDVYAPTTVLAPDDLLQVDGDAAGFLGDCFGFGASVLEEWRAGASSQEAPARVQLWPEHFDLSVDLGVEGLGRRATYGVSPGDATHEQPYLYVTPWAPRSGAFWNEGTFASLGFAAFADAADQRRAALDFFARARAELTA